MELDQQEPEPEIISIEELKSSSVESPRTPGSATKKLSFFSGKRLSSLTRRKGSNKNSTSTAENEETVELIPSEFDDNRDYGSAAPLAAFEEQMTSHEDNQSDHRVETPSGWGHGWLDAGRWRELAVGLVLAVARNVVWAVTTVLRYVPFYDVKSGDGDGETQQLLGQGDYDDSNEPKERLYHICRELLTTEEEYVKKLDILVMVKKRTAKILKPEVAVAMFKDIEVVCTFHKESFLPQLQERLQHWETQRRIGDIMKRLTPFLKLYTEYVTNFENGYMLVDRMEKKSGSFAKLLKEVKENPSSGRLKVQAHMLEPIQRVPRYELLLRDYLRKLPNNSPDRLDTEKALELVSEAASHFENMMKRDTRIGELVQLQSQLDGAVTVVSPSRELLKKGKVMTISAKNNKKVDRQAFLFNDLFLLCNTPSGPGGSGKYKVKHVIDLNEAQTADGNNIDLPDTFYVKATDDVVELCLNSPEDKIDWHENILRQIGACTKEKLLEIGSRRIMDPQASDQETIGQRAPVPVRGTEVTMCMLCAAEFGTLRRKRHCRGCGIVVCGKCCSHSAYLSYDKGKPLKVCDECFVLLTDRQRAPQNGREGSPGSDSLDGATGTSVANRAKTLGAAVQCGMLQLSSDGRKSWKRRWFALHDSCILYSFKALQDIVPMTSMALIGYTFSLEDGLEKAGMNIKLEGMGKTYWLQHDTEAVLHSWWEQLQTIQTASRTQDQLDEDAEGGRPPSAEAPAAGGRHPSPGPPDVGKREESPGVPRSATPGPGSSREASPAVGGNGSEPPTGDDGAGEPTPRGEGVKEILRRTDRASAERASGERASGERASGERASGEAGNRAGIYGGEGWEAVLDPATQHAAATPGHSSTEEGAATDNLTVNEGSAGSSNGEDTGNKSEVLETVSLGPDTNGVKSQEDPPTVQ